MVEPVGYEWHHLAALPTTMPPCHPASSQHTSKQRNLDETFERNARSSSNPDSPLGPVASKRMKFLANHAEQHRKSICFRACPRIKTVKVSGAGVGVGMLRGAGDSLTWKPKSDHISISCFLIDMKFTSKMLKKVLVGSSSFPGTSFRNVTFSKFHIIKLSNSQFIISNLRNDKLLICMSNLWNSNLKLLNSKC